MEDEIISVRKRRDENGRVFGYELVTRKCLHYVRPFVHIYWLTHGDDKLPKYASLLKKYAGEHPEMFPELFVLVCLILLPAFPQLSFLKPLFSRWFWFN